MTERSFAITSPARRGLLLGALLGVGGIAAAGTDDDTAFARNFDGMRLVDQDRRHFSFSALKGQVLLVNWVYTGCSAVCPVQTHALAEIQRALPSADRAGIRFVSVALDPLSDTPAALKAYALRMGCDLSNWQFVTGSREDIDRLDTKLRLFRPGARRPDDHTSSLWLVDARGRLIQRLPGSPPDAARVLRELGDLRKIA